MFDPNLDMVRREFSQFGVANTTQYEGKENASLPYYRRPSRKTEEAPKKEKPKSNSRIDFVA